MDISLPFGLRWAACCCQDTTFFITRALKEQGGTVLNYIDYFGGVSSEEHIATQPFDMLRSLLQCLGFKEAVHKVSPPAQVITCMAGPLVEYSGHDSHRSMGKQCKTPFV